MARLINFPNHGSRSATPGERRFARRLESLLEDDYLCWYDVPVGSQRLHPDFIVLHPSRGLLILEVKDWKIDTLREIDKFSVDLQLETGAVERVANPLEQARSYAHAISDCLSSDPQLRRNHGPHMGKLSFPYGCGVVLANITRKQLDAALSEDEQELVLPPHLVICKDEMTESADAMEFQERLWGMFTYQFGGPLTLPQIERVRWHLFPEVRINAVQQDFLSESRRPEKQTSVPEIVRVMDLQQEQLARNLGGGHRVIHGVAGSGKTLILGYRCLHLAQTAHKPVLVLCFNVTLAARLRAFTIERGIQEKVHIYHFHGWCRTQLQTYHFDLLPSNKPHYERQVDSVIAAVEKGRIPRAQYGAVMIDEGHDFQPEWFKLIVQMIDPASDSLLLLYDDAQSIYKKNGGLDFSLSSVGIKAAGRTTILRLNYRNTREILEFAFEFSKDFIAPHTADDDHIPIIQPEAAGASGPKPAFRMRDTLADEIDFAANCIIKWHRAGEPLNEIAVVCANHAQGRLMSRRLERESLPHLQMESHEEKNAFDPAQPKISILSAQSSKGLEFNSVIFIGLGSLSDDGECAQAKLIYVGMTRARARLVLTASARNRFTERLTALAA